VGTEIGTLNATSMNQKRHWMGGVRKKVKAAKSSKEDKQRQFFEQIRRTTFRAPKPVQKVSQYSQKSLDYLALNEPAIENQLPERKRHRKYDEELPKKVSKYFEQKKEQRPKTPRSTVEAQISNDKPSPQKPSSTSPTTVIKQNDDRIAFVDEGIDRTDEVYSQIIEEEQKELYNTSSVPVATIPLPLPKDNPIVTLPYVPQFRFDIDLFAAKAKDPHPQSFEHQFLEFNEYEPPSDIEEEAEEALHHSFQKEP